VSPRLPRLSTSRVVTSTSCYETVKRLRDPFVVVGRLGPTSREIRCRDRVQPQPVALSLGAPRLVPRRAHVSQSRVQSHSEPRGSTRLGSRSSLNNATLPLGSQRSRSRSPDAQREWRRITSSPAGWNRPSPDLPPASLAMQYSSRSRCVPWCSRPAFVSKPRRSTGGFLLRARFCISDLIIQVYKRFSG